jgi:AcrR family transcriptional regulator
MARSGRRRGTDGSAGDARAALLAATVHVLAASGFSATSARAVAERAGVAPGGVFYHFGSMEDLLAEAFDACLQRRLDRFGAALAVPRERLPEALATTVRAELASPDSRVLLELVMGAVTLPALAVRVREGIDRSVGFTREVVDALVGGSPLAAVLPLDLVAQVAASAFFGLSAVDLVGIELDIDGLTDMVAALARLGTPD